MKYQYTTQVPNSVFDIYLPLLSGAELKILLIIIRQTNGWIDKRTGCRKTRDRISHSQFMQKTGLSRRVISKALEKLASMKLISITCQSGNLLQTYDRQGKTNLFYAHNLCTKEYRPTPKERKVYGFKHISEVLGICSRHDR